MLTFDRTHTLPAALVPFDPDSGVEFTNAAIYIDAATWANSLSEEQRTRITHDDVTDTLIDHINDHMYRHYPNDIETFTDFFHHLSAFDFDIKVRFDQDRLHEQVGVPLPTLNVTVTPYHPDTEVEFPGAAATVDAREWLHTLPSAELSELVTDRYRDSHVMHEHFLTYLDTLSGNDIVALFTMVNHGMRMTYRWEDVPAVDDYIAHHLWNALELETRNHLTGTHNIERDPSQSIIVSDEEQDDDGTYLCWSNEQGWVPYQQADRYSDRDRTDLRLPIASRCANDTPDVTRPQVETLTGVRRDSAAAALKVLAGASKAVACRAVDTDNMTLLSDDADIDAAECIVMDCKQGIVNALSVAALLNAMGVDATVVRAATHADVRLVSEGETVIVDERDWSVGYQTTGLPQTLDTGAAPHGHGNPLYVARKLRNMPGV